MSETTEKRCCNHLVGDEVLGAECSSRRAAAAIKCPLPGIECHHHGEVVTLGIGNCRQQRLLRRL